MVEVIPGKKGFVLTLSAILLLSSVLLFSQFYLNKTALQNSEILEGFHSSKAAFLLDDISSDFNKLLGASVDINRGSSSLRISVKDRLSGDYNKMNVLSLQSFLQKGYAEKQAASISLDLNRLVDGQTELVFSNGIHYDFSYDQNFFLFHKPSSSTNATAYDLNVSVNAFSDYYIPWAWNPSGDLSVSFRYSDQNSLSSINYSGKVDSSIQNNFTFHYNDGTQLVVSVGAIGSSLKALRLSKTFSANSSRATYSFNAFLPADNRKPFYAFYDADLNYSQLDVNSFSKIVVARG
ncbi:MAG: hypothetical protein V1494_01680 [Candidatus Diapherotrites archaeon]